MFVEYLDILPLYLDSLLLLQGVLAASGGLLEELKSKINVSLPPAILSPHVSVHMAIMKFTICVIVLEDTAVLKTVGLLWKAFKRGLEDFLGGIGIRLRTI